MFVYVGSRTTKERNARGEGISVYRMDPASGDWTPIQLVKDLVNPSFLALDREQRFLYTVHGDFSEVSSFRVDGKTGHLTFLNRQSTEGTNPAHLVVDPSNRFVVIANYATGTVATLPIKSDGSLAPVCDLVALPGEPGPHRVQQQSSHPHHVPFDRTGRFIVVPDKGLDKVFVFRLDSGSGKLKPNDPPLVQTREGAAPRHVDFHPSAPYAYVINELDSTVTTYRYDAQHGTLHPLQIVSSLPQDYTGNNTGAEIVFSPSGRYVYASNRGHDSIALFDVDAATGLLNARGWQPTGGKGPRFFALDPSGAFLFAANELSDTITAFRVDQDTGKLTATNQLIGTGSPVCIAFGGHDREAL